MNAKPRKIHIVFHDAGGGHRNAAFSLKSIIEQQNRPWQVELVQFQELTDRLDVLRRVTGIRIPQAMAAGVTDRLWGVSDLMARLEAGEPGLGSAA